MRSSSRWLTLSECGSRFHVHDAACWYVASLRWFTEVDRQRSGEHDKRFLLGRMAVAFARRARLVAPHVRANVPHARDVAELGHVPGRLTVGVRPRFPALLIRRDDAGTHRRRMTPVLRTRRPPRGARRADQSGALRRGDGGGPSSAYGTPTSTILGSRLARRSRRLGYRARARLGTDGSRRTHSWLRPPGPEASFTST